MLESLAACPRMVSAADDEMFSLRDADVATDSTKSLHVSLDAESRGTSEGQDKVHCGGGNGPMYCVISVVSWAVAQRTLFFGSYVVAGPPVVPDEANRNGFVEKGSKSDDAEFEYEIPEFWKDFVVIPDCNI